MKSKKIILVALLSTIFSTGFCFADDASSTASSTLSNQVATTTFNLIYSAGNGGTLTGSTTQIVDQNLDGVAVTAVTDSGYQFMNWSDGSASSTRIDTNVISNINVTANFTSTTESFGSGGNSTDTTTVETRTVHLKIITDSKTIFDDNISFKACKAKETDTVAVFSAYCAINQANVNATWDFSWGPAYIASIGGVPNDYVLNKYWLYFSKSENGSLEYGTKDSYDQKILSNGDNFLVENNIYPLKINIATTTPNINSTTTISVKEFGFVGWQDTWFPSASSTLLNSIGEQYNTDANGMVDVLISTTTPVIFYATKNGFINSNSVIIQAIDNSPIATTTATTTNTDVGGSGGGGGTIVHNKPDPEKMLAFLDANQNSDGSFGSDLYTDWAAVAYGSASGHNTAKSKLINFLKTDSLDGNAVTDYERRAMAMMALGLNPYSDGKENYISKITSSFSGNQIGDTSLFNDDIFGIIVLISAGYTSNDEIIKKSAQFVISKQSSNGEWDSIDMTAAAIQALSLTTNVSGSQDSINKGIQFLKNSQISDGGFYNDFSTSWAIQGLIAGNQIPETLLSSGSKNPFDYLYSLQQLDGGMEASSSSINTRIWSTEYAIPAVEGMDWNHILKSVSKPSTGSSSDSSQATSTAITATSSLSVATTSVSTLSATSTLEATSSVALPLKLAKHFLFNSGINRKKTMEPKILDNEASTISSSSTRVNSNIAGVGDFQVPWVLSIIILIFGGFGYYLYRRG